MKATFGEKIFYTINGIVLLLLALICIYPLIYVASSSFSSVQAIATGKVLIFPVEFTVGAYKAVFAERDIWLGYANAIFYTLVGTLTSIVLTICGAYPLSKKDLKGKTAILLLVAVTMWFNAGVVPNYLNFVELGMLNTRMAVILCQACSGMYVIIMRAFFESIPDSLEEAARIDGAGHLKILTSIYLPLSKASIATVGLMYGIARWNAYLWPMLLLSNSPEKQPLQVVLKRMLVDVTTSITQGGDVVTDYSVKMMTYAIIMVSVLPMLMIYPFVQKYFEKGIMIGSVKG